MKNLRHRWSIFSVRVLLMLANSCLQSTAAQVVDDSACPKHAVDIAAFATGAPLAIDAVVPLAEVALPLRWDDAQHDLQLADDTLVFGPRD